MAREESARQRLMHFVTSAKGAVLTIGALAGAVGAVIALLPKHEHAPSTLKASFSKVTVYPNVDLQEYEERFAPHPAARIDSGGTHPTAMLRAPYRSGGTHPTAVLRAPYRLVAATSSAIGGESEATPSDTSTSTTPSESTTSTTTTETSETTETTTTEASSGSGEAPSAPFKETNGVLARDGNGSDPEAEHAGGGALSEIAVPLQQIAAAKSSEGESKEGENAEVGVPEA